MAENKPSSSPQPTDPDFRRRQLRLNQVTGVILGLIAALMSANFWPALPAAVTWGGVLMWGAAIGALIGSLAQFDKLGKLITRSENRVFNVAVGVALPLLLILVLALILGAANQ